MPSIIAIYKPYLLVTNINSYIDRNGKRYVDQLWFKDLQGHVSYLKNFQLAAPCRHCSPPSGTIAIETDERLMKIRFVDLPASNSIIGAVTVACVTINRLWKVIRQVDIVHAGIAGWPIPLGWLVTPFVLIHQKKYIIIVESAPWRLNKNSKNTLTTRLKSKFFEMMGRWCVNSSSLSIFTQSEYKISLLSKHIDRGHIIPASWIDSNNIINKENAKKNWINKTNNYTNLRLIFVGRLQVTKGINVLLDAIEICNRHKIRVDLDILGDGELFNACAERVILIKQLPECFVNINLLGTLPYDSNFFRLISAYHAVVIPSITDEQPRIIYDAYSQAVPVLASDTAGLSSCIDHARTGMLFASNEPNMLAELFIWSSQNISRLQEMGLESLNEAQLMTHEKMHQRRLELILKIQ